MRKDVILGMTIGGVMLAVVIVYLTITPSGKHKRHPVDTGAQIADGAGGLQDSSPQGTDPTKPGDASAANAEVGAIEQTVLRPTAQEKLDPVWGNKLFPKSTPLIGVSQNPDPNAASADKLDNIGGGGDQPPVRLSPAIQPKEGTGASSGGSTLARDAFAPSTQPSGKMHTHRIAKGENFSTIAAAYYGSPNFYPHIQRANPSVDPTRLKLGTEINLPDIADVKPPEKAPEKALSKPVESHLAEAQLVGHRKQPTFDPKTEYLVQSSDSLYRISLKLYGTPDMVDRIYALNKTAIGDNPAKLKLWMILKLPADPTAKEPVAKQ